VWRSASLAFRYQTKRFWFAVLFCLLLADFAVLARADVVTTGAFSLDFAEGEAFTYQDTAHNINMTFTAYVGNLTGSALLSASSAGGRIVITPSSDGVLKFNSTNSNVTVFSVNFVPAFTSTYSYSSGIQFQVDWSFNYTYYEPIVVSGTNGTLYFRSDTFFTNNITGYGLHTEKTDSEVTVSDFADGNVSSSFGFRVWHVNVLGNLTELTGGSPDATVARSVNGTGFQYGSWACSEKTLSIGADALKVIVYAKFGSGDWEAVATFISKTLIAKAIQSSTWNFTAYTTREYNETSNVTTATFVFGSLNMSSNISNIRFWEPTPQEVALALGLHGDWIGMFLYPFLYLIGDLFYGIGLLFLAVLYYLRFKRWEPVLILILVFGGGGLFGYLIPNIAYRLIYIVILFVFATQLYRVFN